MVITTSPLGFTLILIRGAGLRGMATLQWREVGAARPEPQAKKLPPLVKPPYLLHAMKIRTYTKELSIDRSPGLQISSPVCGR